MLPKSGNQGKMIGRGQEIGTVAAVFPITGGQVFSDFMLSSPDGDVNNSPIYQNPGWPIEDGASALELPN